MKAVSALAAKYNVKANIRQGVHLDDMTDAEIYFLMSWFVYHLSSDLRRKLMTEHPVLYKRLVNLKEPVEINVPGEPVKIPQSK